MPTPDLLASIDELLIEQAEFAYELTRRAVDALFAGDAGLTEDEAEQWERYDVEPPLPDPVYRAYCDCEIDENGHPKRQHMARCPGQIAGEPVRYGWGFRPLARDGSFEFRQFLSVSHFANEELDDGVPRAPWRPDDWHAQLGLSTVVDHDGYMFTDEWRSKLCGGEGPHDLTRPSTKETP